MASRSRSGHRLSTTWTRDGELHHPRYQGLCTEKDPDNVVRETR
jgi:hypothetical protein